MTRIDLKEELLKVTSFYMKNPYTVKYKDFNKLSVEFLDKGWFTLLGYPSERGKNVIDKHTEVVKDMHRGIPFLDYKLSNEKKEVTYKLKKPRIHRIATQGIWRDIQHPELKVQYIRDASCIVVGALLSNMKRANQTEDQKIGNFSVLESVYDSFTRLAPFAYFEAMPHTYCNDPVYGMEVIWLSNQEQSLFIPVQAAYYDFIQGRIPTKLSIMASKNIGNPVMFFAENGAKRFILFQHIAGVIVPLKKTGDIPEPTERLFVWREHFQKENGAK